MLQLQAIALFFIWKSKSFLAISSSFLIFSSVSTLIALIFIWSSAINSWCSCCPRQVCSNRSVQRSIENPSSINIKGRIPGLISLIGIHAGRCRNCYERNSTGTSSVSRNLLIKCNSIGSSTPPRKISSWLYRSESI